MLNSSSSSEPLESLEATDTSRPEYNRHHNASHANEQIGNRPARGRGAQPFLAACLRSGRLPHAVLVEGAGGSALAGKIARAALCSGAGEKPCGRCRDCLKAEKGAHPDLIVITGGDRTRSFHIDAVRSLRREAYIRPNEADRKVFILENAHNMTVQAQNALLKIIEEPPAGVMFILTCDNKSAMLETVLSRVTVFSLAGAEPEPDELRVKAAAALDQLLSGSELTALAAFAAYERDRAGFAGFLAAMREEAAVRVIGGARTDGDAPGYRADLFRVVEIIDDLERALELNVGGLLATVILPGRLKAGV